jgi:hypothetical protein
MAMVKAPVGVRMTVSADLEKENDPEMLALWQKMYPKLVAYFKYPKGNENLNNIRANLIGTNEHDK